MVGQGLEAHGTVFRVALVEAAEQSVRKVGCNPRQEIAGSRDECSQPSVGGATAGCESLAHRLLEARNHL